MLNSRAFKFANISENEVLENNGEFTVYLSFWAEPVEKVAMHLVIRK